MRPQFGILLVVALVLAGALVYELVQRRSLKINPCRYAVGPTIYENYAPECSQRMKAAHGRGMVVYDLKSDTCYVSLGFKDWQLFTDIPMAACERAGLLK